MESANAKILLRPHPADLNRFRDVNDIAIANGIEFSNPLVNTLHFDFSRSRRILAGESTVYLDAILKGLSTAIPVEFLKHTFDDWYGYIESGLVVIIKNNIDYSTFLNDYSQNNLNSIQYFSHSYGKEWWGSEYEYVCAAIFGDYNKFRELEKYYEPV